MTELIISFVELIIFLLLTGGFTCHNFFNSKISRLISISIIFNIIYIPILEFIDDEFILFFLHLLLTLSIVKYYYGLRITDTICSFLCSYIFIVILQLPYVYAYTNILKLSNPDILAISCIFYCLCITIIIERLVHISRFYNLIFKNNNLGIVLIANFFAFVYIVSMYYKINSSHFIDIIIFFIVTLMLLISINIVALNQFSTIRKQRKQLDAYEEYFPMIESLITTVRRRQHHHSNEIQAILSLMYNNKDYDSLVNAINEHLELSKQLDMPAYILKINMKMIAGFLYMKEQEAAKNNKFLIIEVDNYELKSKAPEYVLVELFGILIDNALDETACGEKAYVYIDSIDGKIIFKTRNKGYKMLCEHRTKFFTPGYSTKNTSVFSRKHAGLGLPTLRNIVIEQYKGRVRADNEGPDNDIIFQITI